MEQQEQWYPYEGGISELSAGEPREPSYDGVAENVDEASYLKQIHDTFR